MSFIHVVFDIFYKMQKSYDIEVSFFLCIEHGRTSRNWLPVGMVLGYMSQIWGRVIEKK